MNYDDMLTYVREKGCEHTQKKLGEVVGVSKSAVNKWMQGQRDISLKTLIAIAEYCGDEVIIRKRGKK